MATTAIATSYAGSLTINPGDVLGSNGAVYVGLLGNSGNKSGTGVTAAIGTTPSVDKLTGQLVSQGSYYSQVSLLNGASSTSPVFPETSTSWATTNCPQTGTVGNCQNTIYTPSAGPTFNLLGDNIFADRGKTDQMWVTASTGTTSAATGNLTIPVGVFGVTSISTMLNTMIGGSGAGTVCTTSASAQTNGSTGCTGTNAYADIVFTFEDSADFLAGNTNNLQTETLALINGVSQENMLGGTGLSGSYTAQDIDQSGAAAGATYTVGLGNVWEGATTVAGNGGTPANNTALALDYQTFPIFTNYQNLYLVSIAINNLGSTSQEVLSGVTLQTPVSTSTPEPSTMVMLLAGLGALGLSVIRRQRA
jgi:hypothetical protein